MRKNILFLISFTMFFNSAVHAQVTVQTQVPATAVPSEDAIKICADKSVGDVCSFTNEQGTSINGKCNNTQSNGQGKMVCVPIK